MALLGVNIDHIASVRQLRKGFEPDPAHAALACERAGADSIVVHLREDRRHIREQDVLSIKRKIGIPLNLEMSVAGDIVAFALKTRPFQATLVPEKRRELTTEGGLDVIKGLRRISSVVERLTQRNIRVSLFIDPDVRQIKAALETPARLIELHTGGYAQIASAAKRQLQLKKLKDAALFAREQGFKVFAGHGLDYENVKAIVRIPQIEELNIGYSIVCRALFTGIGPAVSSMKELVR